MLAITGALVILALSVAAVGCSQDAANTPSPPPTETPTSTPAPIEPAPTQPAPAPTQPAPDPTPTQAAPEASTPVPDGSDAYFALDRVLDVSIEIAPEDWDILRGQTRTFEDLMAEIEEYGLSQPFADIYTWFSGTVTVDGETYSNVGVRKKGFLGSMSDVKPSLKLRFDKYVDDQSLGGVIERMTLNNSLQDPSMVNTCLAYGIFAAAGSPAPRCSFATVSVNGKELGLYLHVEEIKKPFLARHFDSAEGNLYEGTISDFDPEYRGTFEKKTNEDEDDWSDIDAVVAALQDPSDDGLKVLAQAVDLDRFLSFWAAEVLVGHWDGYAGNRNNYHFYHEPGGPFVFIPWGADDTFHLKDDPNPFDDVSDPPPSVLALTAIPNRLYNDADWRQKYVARLKLLLDTVWDEKELLDRVDELAAVVREYALPEARDEAADDTERVRKFILKRRGEILADVTPEPPDWPEPGVSVGGLGAGTLEIRFETTWGSNQSANPFEAGTVTHFALNDLEEAAEDLAAVAGFASPDEQLLMPGVPNLVSIAIFGIEPDGSVNGGTVVLPPSLMAGGTTLVIGEDEIAGGVWSIAPGSTVPDFVPFTQGKLELREAGTSPGAAIVGSFSGAFGGPPSVPGGEDGGSGGTTPMDIGLVINEVAAKGDPLDWFELHNTLSDPIGLFGFMVADDLTDAGKRVAFPAGLEIAPGEYLQVEVDKEGWPGFALGGDEELGIWLADGTLVAMVDWEEGQSGEGESYARVPDTTGDFQTVSSPTPGAANRP